MANRLAQRLVAVAIVCSIAYTLEVAAQSSYPTRPIRLIVGFPAGGATDVVARILAQELSGVWPQNVIVENRVGASGTIGADAVAKAAPDGHTLLIATLVANATAPSVYSKLPYDPQRDFAYIAPISKQLNLLLVHPSVSARTLQELVDYTRANKGKVAYSSAGVGLSSHLGMEIILQATGMEMLHVPYKGSAPATQAMLAGETLVSLELVPSALPHLRAGKAHAIAVASDQRAPQLPDVPTFGEIGGPKIEIYTWSGIAAPAATPQDVIERIHGGFTAVLRKPEVRERLSKMGAEPMELSPDAFQRFVAAEAKKWGEIARKVGARLD